MAQFQHLGAYLKAKRIEAGFTQAEIAEQFSYSNGQFVSNWERGLCSPASNIFQNLIDLLKLNKHKLMEVMVEDGRAEIIAKVYKKKLSLKATKAR